MVTFDLAPLLQGQTREANLLGVFISELVFLCIFRFSQHIHLGKRTSHKPSEVVRYDQEYGVKETSRYICAGFSA